MADAAADLLILAALIIPPLIAMFSHAAEGSVLDVGDDTTKVPTPAEAAKMTPAQLDEVEKRIKKEQESQGTRAGVANKVGWGGALTAAGLLTAGSILTATGIGAPAGLPMMALGAGTLGAGALGYGMYENIQESRSASKASEIEAMKDEQSNKSFSMEQERLRKESERIEQMFKLSTARNAESVSSGGMGGSFTAKTLNLGARDGSTDTTINLVIHGKVQ